MTKSEFTEIKESSERYFILYQTEARYKDEDNAIVTQCFIYKVGENNSKI